jgi:hypothetical protein
LDEVPECKVDLNSFEPQDAVKGDVARIVFYMATCYAGENGNPNLELSESVPSPESELGKLSTLLQWHINDPVDDFERTRNNRIFEITNRRNPFIDMPELANKIWDTESSVGEMNTLGNLGFYPNLATDYIYVTGVGRGLAVEVYNVLGRKCITKAIVGENALIDIHTLPKGVYFIVVGNNGMLLKFVKN